MRHYRKTGFVNRALVLEFRHAMLFDTRWLIAIIHRYIVLYYAAMRKSMSRPILLVPRIFARRAEACYLAGSLYLRCVCYAVLRCMPRSRLGSKSWDKSQPVQFSGRYIWGGIRRRFRMAYQVPRTRLELLRTLTIFIAINGEYYNYYF